MKSVFFRGGGGDVKLDCSCLSRLDDHLLHGENRRHLVSAEDRYATCNFPTVRHIQRNDKPPYKPDTCSMAGESCTNFDHILINVLSTFTFKFSLVPIWGNGKGTSVLARQLAKDLATFQNNNCIQIWCIHILCFSDKIWQPQGCLSYQHLTLVIDRSIINNKRIIQIMLLTSVRQEKS